MPVFRGRSESDGVSMTPLEALAQAVRNGGGVLFVGSRMTADSGGASWADLAKWVAAEMGVLPQETPKDTLDDLCIRLGRTPLAA